MPKKNLILIMFIVFTSIQYCQVETALLLMNKQKSPFLIGAGEIGAAIPMKTAEGFYMNPAQLGYFSKENTFSVFFMPQETKWVPNFFMNIPMYSFGAAAGFNFSGKKIPLSVGVGYFRNSIKYNPDMGEDIFNSFAVGACYEYYLNFNLGFGIKSFTSNFLSMAASSKEKHQASGTAFDLGMMITAPISKLALKNAKINAGDNVVIKPNFDITLGYSASNIGDEIYYADPAQKDPLPRTARLGYTIDFSIEAQINKTPLKMFGYSFTVEASDILVKNRVVNPSSSYAGPMNTEYQGPFGDIEFVKHLVELKGDDNVIVHRGHIFRLFETLTFTSGRFAGNYWGDIKSNGISVSSDGLFKLLNIAIDSRFTNYLANHFSIEYSDSYTFADSNMETSFKGIVLNYKRIVL